jgi:hypothetical protein
MSHVVVIVPAAGAAGEIITTSKDFGKYVFLHFPTGPVACKLCTGRFREVDRFENTK